MDDPASMGIIGLVLRDRALNPLRVCYNCLKETPGKTMTSRFEREGEKRATMCKRKGFTLIELLVVIRAEDQYDGGNHEIADPKLH